jgi:hypothetical protein
LGVRPQCWNTSRTRAAPAPQAFAVARTSRSEITLQEQTIMITQPVSLA